MKHLDDSDDLEQYAPEVRAFFDFSEDLDEEEEDADTVIDDSFGGPIRLTKKEREAEEAHDRHIRAMQERITAESAEWDAAGEDDEEDWEEEDDAQSEKMKFLSADEEQ